MIASLTFYNTFQLLAFSPFELFFSWPSAISFVKEKTHRPIQVTLAQARWKEKGQEMNIPRVSCVPVIILGASHPFFYLILTTALQTWHFSPCLQMRKLQPKEVTQLANQSKASPPQAAEEDSTDVQPGAGPNLGSEVHLMVSMIGPAGPPISVPPPIVPNFCLSLKHHRHSPAPFSVGDLASHWCESRAPGRGVLKFQSSLTYRLTCRNTSGPLWNKAEYKKQMDEVDAFVTLFTLTPFALVWPWSVPSLQN